MKENFKLGAILLTITMIAGLLLGFTNEATKEKILENSKINKDDLAYIMPEAEAIRDTDLEIDSEEKIGVKEIYEAISGNDVVGHVIKVTAKGFHGAVDYVVGIRKDASVSGIKVLAHTETPGLGARITEESFTERFRNKPIEEELVSVKITPSKDFEVEGISGASVSSKATVTAVNDAIRFYKESIKGYELAPKEETDADTGASEN